MIVRGKLRGRRLDRWAYDNGAYEDWRAKRPFDRRQFLRDLRSIAAGGPQPDFVVLPDRVAAGLQSLQLSMRWLRRLRRKGLDRWPLYLAVQNGMAADDIPWSEVAGVFIGGTNDWKASTAATWVAAAHQHGLPCHYARCGTGRKVDHAKGIKADSLDSCLPLWSAANLRQFLRALRQQVLIHD
jgi:hypothetical protein